MKITPRRLLYGAVVVFSLVGSGEQIKIDPISWNRLYPVSELRVNNNEFRTYVGPEEEGIRMMMDAALTSPEEDAWLQYEIDGQTYFADIGCNPKAGKFEFVQSAKPGTFMLTPPTFGASLQYDMKRRYTVLSRLPHGTITRSYHIHPVNTETFKVFKAGVEDHTRPSRKDLSTDEQCRRTEEKSFPIFILPSMVVGVEGYSYYPASHSEFSYKRLRDFPESHFTEKGAGTTIGKFLMKIFR